MNPLSSSAMRRCCGTCWYAVEWWRESNEAAAVGKCIHPVPQWILNSMRGCVDDAKVLKEDGQCCDCWKAHQ